MKIVLSRKGFDSAAGGVASPIFLDGRMLSLAIPSSYSPVRYSDIGLDGLDLGKLVEDLTRGEVGRNDGTHLDPDLNRSARARKRGWEPLFGQADGEQTVLERAGVGPGDLFLFFGWFRRVEERDGRFAFVRAADDLHVVWGWLQVAAVYDLTAGSAPSWAEGHPHLDATPRRKNALYEGASSLVIDGRHGTVRNGCIHSLARGSAADCSGEIAVGVESAVVVPARDADTAWLPRRCEPLESEGRAGDPQERWARAGVRAGCRGVSRFDEMAHGPNTCRNPRDLRPRKTGMTT